MPHVPMVISIFSARSSDGWVPGDNRMPDETPSVTFSPTRRLPDNLIGWIGLTAWAAITATSLSSMIRAWPKAFFFIPTPLRSLVEIMANALGAPPASQYGAFLLAYALLAACFGWAFWRRTRTGFVDRSSAATGLLLAQSLIALAVETQLLVVVAVELAFVLPRRPAFRWLVALMLAYSVIQFRPFSTTSALPSLEPVEDLLQFGMSMVWLLVSFGVGRLASTEREGRMGLAVAHAQLLATQELLADTLRMTERARISRDLHDAIGHHLTALNLHLNLGLRHAGDQAHPSFPIALELAKGLLVEVRGVVHGDRQERFIDLRRSLEVLCAGIPFPRVRLHCEHYVAVNTPALAHTLFRSIQEALTNVIRHSGASNVDVFLSSHLNGIAAEIHDDGIGVRSAPDGQGIRGMRSRIEEQRGTLSIANRQPRGLTVCLWLPLGVEQ